MAEPLLDVSDLTIALKIGARSINIVDGISFRIDPGDRLGVVGESGSGKSMIALALMGLLPNVMQLVSGSIRFQGEALELAPPARMRQIRGRDISLVFQEPATALNPVFTTGRQVSEVLREHEKISAREARNRTIELFRQVGIPAPERRISDYPHQMSGGMRQRVMIAMALACRPKLIVADEATTALDVTTQAQILDLLRQLQVETGAAMIFVTHDLGVVAEIADRVAVMYSGRIVEVATADALFEAPRHPYTRGLMACRLHVATPSAGRLAAIEGVVPPPSARPAGCAFAPRCPKAEAVCANRPALLGVGAAQAVACHSIGPAR